LSVEISQVMNVKISCGESRDEETVGRMKERIDDGDT
jgi:hypothetical protein